MRPTLILIHHHLIDGVQYLHGDELPPGILTQHEINKWLDAGKLKENRERRSLYRLFSAFSGSEEKESLDKDELSAYTLPS